MSSTSKKIHRLQRRVASVTLALSVIGGSLGILLLCLGAFSSLDIILLITMYSITTLGIGVGFHRYYTHRAFKTGKIIQFILGIAGSMAMQGPLLFWVASHRCHHQYSDSEGDPHSPNVGGFWYAHIGWMFSHKFDGYSRYINDIRTNDIAAFVSKYYLYWVLLGMLIPAAVGYFWTLSIKQAFIAFCWGGPIRIFLLHHSTWSVNSICHLFGARDYETKDLSRNNPYIALLTFGEGWHNNHHAYPYSARHGLRWWQFDISYIVILTLGKLGLLWDIKLPVTAPLEPIPNSVVE